MFVESVRRLAGHIGEIFRFISFIPLILAVVLLGSFVFKHCQDPEENEY